MTQRYDHGLRKRKPISYREPSDESENEEESYEEAAVPFQKKSFRSSLAEYNSICKRTEQSADDFEIDPTNGNCQVVGNPFVHFIARIDMSGKRSGDLSSTFNDEDAGYGGREENTYFCFSDIHHTNFDGRGKCDMVEAQRFYHKYWPHSGPFSLHKKSK